MSETGIPDAVAGSQDAEVTLISAGAGERLAQALRDFWRYRELFRAFVVRDLKVRYRQTLVGVAWVVLQPLLTSGVLAAALTRVGFVSGGGAGPFLYFLAALAPWTSFSSAVQASSQSLEANSNLITKVYFPRMLVPLGGIAGTAVDFVIAMTVLLLVSLGMGRLDFGLLALAPLLLVIQYLFAGGIGLALSALNAQYRDVKYVVPVMMQLLMLLTVLAPLDRWQGSVRTLLMFNPMAAVVEHWRAICAGGRVDAWLLAAGSSTALVLLAAGLAIFRNREARMIDVL